MSRASTERKRLSRKHESQIARANDNIAVVHAAAVHEAAHVVSALHYGCPIGRRGVRIELSRSGKDASGYSDTLWASHGVTMTADFAWAYASWVSTFVAPFAEFHLREKNTDFNFDNLVESAVMDFGTVLCGLSQSTVTAKAAMNYGWLCFTLWLGRDVSGQSAFMDSDGGAVTRDLVRDADALLRAYWPQIVGLANALIDSEKWTMSAEDIEMWRKVHFRGEKLLLSERAVTAETARRGIVSTSEQTQSAECLARQGF